MPLSVFYIRHLFMQKVQEVLNIKDLQKALELYRQDNITDKVNELEIAIANLNLDL